MKKVDFTWITGKKYTIKLNSTKKMLLWLEIAFKAA